VATEQKTVSYHFHRSQNQCLNIYTATLIIFYLYFQTKKW